MVNPVPLRISFERRADVSNQPSAVLYARLGLDRSITSGTIVQENTACRIKYVQPGRANGALLRISHDSDPASLHGEIFIDKRRPV
ncbi:MAG: hypothetical protein NTV58_00235 [Deltaproteobacteria bacterium]|nr:hypothetical protein [Deltaproteobacteria bacterium]